MPVSYVCMLALLAIEPAKGYPRGELLIEAAELKKARQKFRILDARTRAQYQEGHVRGAAWVSHLEWSREFTNTKDPKKWGDRIGNLGIDAATPVVVYADGITPDAALIWWLLRYWGVRDVRLLNGGWKAWKGAAGEAVETEPALRAKRFVPTPQETRLATKLQIVDRLKGGPVQLIDARSLREHRGETVTAERNGTIPGATHLEWSELVDKSTQKLKNADELARLFQQRGIRTDIASVTFCQSGRRAAVMAFALELMGTKEVRNYVNSWSEWGNDPDTPVQTPAKK